MLENATRLYNEWIDMYKKEYEKVSKSKSEDWKKRYNYENFKEFRNYASKIKDKKTDEEADEEADKETDKETDTRSVDIKPMDCVLKQLIKQLL